ncbi:uncharacterized protein EAE97_010255 [Botrytis byssoidea]|uniref:Uncharacterized protein n=1 Tax=Botrytis byssoidea TaxID=139641 RepID=A0A9P5LU84_9HELO|nr:uncharacterized protein EAE97_010255 [Botrytis byssoidea]KAF7926746.1 hypothetical protein EAE97_010255 [Botrytis byssoidea]
MGWPRVSKGLSLTGNNHQLVFFKRKEGLNHGGPQDVAVSTRAVGAYTRRREKVATHFRAILHQQIAGMVEVHQSISSKA